MQNTWAAYINNNQMFVVEYLHEKNAKYPDYGASYETFTNDSFLELETLSPMVVLEPEQCVVHTEEWKLVNDVKLISNKEEYIDIIIKEYIEKF